MGFPARGAQLLLVSLLAAACLEGGGPLTLGESCGPEDECAAGALCQYGRCRPECAFDRDCPEGATCIPAEGSGSGRVCTLPEAESCPGPDCPVWYTCDGREGLVAHDALGDGSAESPYLICALAQLEALARAPAEDLGQCYRLGADLDAGEPGEAPILAPIGSEAAPFAGTFDGDGHALAGLAVQSMEDGVPVGIFGVLDGAVVSDLALAAVGAAGTAAAGTLAGRMTGAEIREIDVRGAVVVGSGATGGLVGVMEDGAIEGATLADVAALGDESVGGLVGRQQGGSISGCTVTAEVSADRYRVGGLVGHMVGGSIEQCSTAGRVSAPLSSDCVYAGGLVGRVDTGSISRSFASGAVEGEGAVVGGLVGWLGGTVEDSYATGSVTGGRSETCATSVYPPGAYVGGLVGAALQGALVRHCYATGSASAGDGEQVGGLLGLGIASGTSPPRTEACFSTGPSSGADSVGGLIGRLDRGVEVGSYWDVTSSGLTAMCGSSDGEGCDDSRGVTTSERPGYFFGRENPPLDTWDFDTVWDARADGHPSLRWAR